MTLTTAVHGALLRLEADLAAVPTYGLGLWALHSHDRCGGYCDLDIEKLGGADRLPISDPEVADYCGKIAPMPGCYHGLVAHFERGDMTFLVAALREHVTIIVERYLHAEKARCFIVPPERVMVGPCVDVANALHFVVAHSAPALAPKADLPPIIQEIAEKLGLDPDQFGGIVIMGGSE